MLGVAVGCREAWVIAQTEAQRSGRLGAENLLKVEKQSRAFLFAGGGLLLTAVFFFFHKRPNRSRHNVATLTGIRLRNGSRWHYFSCRADWKISKNIRGVEEEVFRVLKWSYSYLENKEAKICFLLCSVFPEDSEIMVEDIVRNGIGLKLFGSIYNVREARDRVHVHLDLLKKCCLLMDDPSNEYVKMHDVIRDVAISIASGKEHSFLVRCEEALKEWPENELRGDYGVISMRCTGMLRVLLDNLEFPRLELLRLESDCRYIIVSPESFYQGMKELKVLEMSLMPILSLPTSLQCLTNLQTLSLYKCELFNQDLSVVGTLMNLEILSITGSDMDELPRALGNLNHLKLLDLLGCSVGRIPHGVLSSLSKLEELYLGNSFSGWDVVEEVKDITVTNACIAELALLPNLVTLDIYVPCIECSVWPSDVVLLENMRAFDISLGKWNKFFFVHSYPSTNRLALDSLDKSRSFMEIRGLKMLLKITRFLLLRSVTLENHNFFSLDEDGFQHLSELEVDNCLDLECLINTSNCYLAKEAFCALKILRLSNLPQLMHLWKGPSQLVCLCNLTKDISIKLCYQLDVIVSDVGGEGEHEIESPAAEEQDEIVSDVGRGGEHEIESPVAEEEGEIVFPELKSLELWYLPKFTDFHKTRNATRLPRLQRLGLKGIPKLNCDANIQPLFNKDTLSTLEELDVTALVDLREIWPKDLQAKLREIRVQYCHKVSNVLFSSNLIQCMQKLELLRVDSCNSVEVAFDLSGLYVDEKGDGPAAAIALPCLATLRFLNLPNLKHVWANYPPTILQGFQNLESLRVDNCGSLRILFSPFVARLLVNLRELNIFSCDAMVAIIGWEEEEEEDDGVRIDTSIFPQLTLLWLRDLKSLTSFCPQACTFQGSFLKYVAIENCPAMDSLPSAVQRVINERWVLDYQTYI
ncbi:hypothetical protein Vadar_006601 [Vaccinium darrowii]|uniref:Uncharacterized protein n=1 Tax=Vaccinium darrowii TaxID=229202 RepID=A0ACB7XP27_9ERIC|nr:hypothetical protein Vadar_006601 [Vaccinium darrowii]